MWQRVGGVTTEIAKGASAKSVVAGTAYFGKAALIGGGMVEGAAKYFLASHRGHQLETAAAHGLRMVGHKTVDGVKAVADYGRMMFRGINRANNGKDPEYGLMAQANATLDMSRSKASHRRRSIQTLMDMTTATHITGTGCVMI